MKYESLVKTRKMLLWVVVFVAITMFLTPFLIKNGAAFLSESTAEGLFLLVELAAIIFIFNEYQRLGVLMLEEKMAGQSSKELDGQVAVEELNQERKLFELEQKIFSVASKLDNRQHSQIITRPFLENNQRFSVTSSKKEMKGIVLAGGTATRLFPLTATTSKQLLPVYDRQMIFYPLNVLIKAGIRHILVIVAPEHSGQFINLLGSIFEKYKIFLEFKVQKVPAGLAEAFVLGENFIGDDNVTMILGDNIFEDDFSSYISDFQKGGMVFAKKVPDPQRYGVVEFDAQGRALSIEEKPENPKSDFCVTGLYTYDNRVIDIAKGLSPSGRGEKEITDVNNKYLDLGELNVQKIDGAWMDAGTFDSLLEASNLVKERQIYKKFHPLVDAAIKEFNEELKELMKKRLL